MPTYVAFLRAVNVGGRTIRMDQLRGLFEELQFADVKTYIASGNVSFQSSGRAASLTAKIESHLHGKLGYEVKTFLRTPADLHRIASFAHFSPLPGANCTIYVALLADPLPAAARKQLAPYQSAVNSFHLEGREVFWLCRGRMSDSQFSGAVLEKALQTPATMRNMNTMRKIAAQLT